MKSSRMEQGKKVWQAQCMENKPDPLFSGAKVNGYRQSLFMEHVLLLWRKQAIVLLN